jgi:membrane-bound metal-dependent hydrolase YbcI (DUF457 family)
MYAGHFAAGLAIKARKPEAPTAGLLAGAVLLDLLFAVFVLAGFERVHLTPGMSPGFALDNVEWSHSLLMAVVWSILFAAAFRRHDWEVRLALGIAVFSHFILDFLVHSPDLALWPGSPIRLGLGMWHRWPHGSWFLELAFILACLAYYVRRSRVARTFGYRAGWVCVIVVALHVFNSPWLSPVMRERGHHKVQQTSEVVRGPEIGASRPGKRGLMHQPSNAVIPAKLVLRESGGAGIHAMPPRAVMSSACHSRAGGNPRGWRLRRLLT